MSWLMMSPVLMPLTRPTLEEIRPMSDPWLRVIHRQKVEADAGNEDLCATFDVHGFESVGFVPTDDLPVPKAEEIDAAPRGHGAVFARYQSVASSVRLLADP